MPNNVFSKYHHFVIGCLSLTLLVGTSYLAITLRTSPDDVIRELREETSRIIVEQQKTQQQIMGLREELNCQLLWISEASEKLGMQPPGVSAEYVRAVESIRRTME